MSTTYLLSYPGRDWQIRGGANFRSQARGETNPRRALREWIALCDAIMHAGGHILIMPPPVTTPETEPLTGLIYTANVGQLFHRPEGWSFLTAKMATPHRVAEAAYVKSFVEKAGFTVRAANHAWEGQADLQELPGSRYVATYGVRSVERSVEDVRPLLPPGAKLLELRTADPFFHGDTCLDPLTNVAGDTVMLAHDGAFPDGGIVPLRRFLGDRVEVMAVERDDALAYACNSLCVNGNILAPSGLSTNLRGQLARRGFQAEELELPELFGKGGGGPRCLVNELRGVVLNERSHDYASLRDQIVAMVESYPEKAAPRPAPSVSPAASAMVGDVSGSGEPKDPA